MLPLLPLVPIAAIAGITKFKLSGENLTTYQTDHETTFDVDPDSAAMKQVNAFLVENFITPAKSGAPKGRLKAKREFFEKQGLSRNFDCEHQPDLIRLDDRAIPGEWTLVKGVEPGRRILYLHGGGYTVGSAISHRAITYNLAKRTKAAVFAPDYRLMPEHSRQDIIDDGKAAYDWIIENGPHGARKAQRFALGGDSAGANLTLALLPWIRDTKRRGANAVFTFSAPVDSTFQSPSIRSNFQTDLMLQPLVAPLLKVPRSALLWISWKKLGLSPAHPMLSPIMADLYKLPPILMQVSTHEMLFDDSVHYAEKARRAGSNVTLQSWSHVPHVFQIFDDLLPEAVHALDEVAAFLKGKL